MIENIEEKINDEEKVDKVDEELEKSQLDEVKLKLKSCEEKAAEYYSYLQRLQADFDNYKKIVVREKEEIGKYIREDVACLILPIVDHLHLARASLEKSKDIKKIKEGLNLILKQFDDFLERLSIEEIKCSGEKFDPTYHEAVCFEETEAEEENKILDVLKIGYKIYDKPIRCAQVKVSKKRESKEEATQTPFGYPDKNG